MSKQINPMRVAWKWWYRKLRIARRESSKAFVDMLIHGSGFVQIGHDVPDLIRHLPIRKALDYFANKPPNKR